MTRLTRFNRLTRVNRYIEPVDPGQDLVQGQGWGLADDLIFFLQCFACWAGTYGTGLLESNWDCAWCGTGWYSTATGATSSDVCVACGVGKYSLLYRAEQVRDTFITSRLLNGRFLLVLIFIIPLARPNPVLLGHPLDAVVVLNGPAVCRDVVWDLHDP